MTAFKITDTVGTIVARRQMLSRVFEQEGINDCCGGMRVLVEACRKKFAHPVIVPEHPSRVAALLGLSRLHKRCASAGSFATNLVA